MFSSQSCALFFADVKLKMNLFLYLIILLFNYASCLELDVFNKYLEKEFKSSSECQLQKEILLEALKNNSEWALESKYIPFDLIEM